MRIPDVERIKRLPAFEVGRALNVIHQQVKNLSPSRWAFSGSVDATYIQFFDRDGSYQDHKRDVGGTCIDLVMQSMHPTKDHDQRYFFDSVKLIADQYDMWLNNEELINKSVAIAKTQSAYTDIYSYLKSALDSVLNNASANGWSDSIQEIDRFLASLDLDRSAVTWGAIAHKTASLGFSPAVPWQGRRCHQKESSKNPGNLHPFGGWTKELAEQWASQPEALRIFCVDIDGDGDRYPRIDLLSRLIFTLKKRNLAPRVVIVSSWGNDKKEERGKAHLYFVAKDRATNVNHFKAWHEHLDANIGAIVNAWTDVEEAERLAFKRDHATHSISRIMRVPGIAKFQTEHAAIIYQVNDKACVDFVEIIETTPVVVDYANRRYHFGHKCEAITIKEVDGLPQEKTLNFGRAIWPLRKYRRVETGETGVLYRYHRSSGRVEYGTMNAAAFVNKNKGQKASAEAAEAGVQIRPESENVLASALGFWAHTGHGQSVELTSKPGWHSTKKGRVYVNGADIYGADGWEVDRNSKEIERRSSRSGTLQEWREGNPKTGLQGANELVSTFGAGFVLGQSLAGPLIELLDLTPFTVHICGDTTHGKSTIARFAGSIWGHPKYTFQSWDATATGIEIAAETANGSCLVLDELKRFGNDKDKLSRVVYGLNSTQGRLKSNAKSEPALQRSWRLTTISTGEFSLYQFLGDSFQGGHGVRFLDVPTRPKDLTTDKAHAKALDRLAYEQHGVVGDHFVRFLCENEEAKASLWDVYRNWLDTTNEWSEHAETLRICDNLAVIGAALSMAAKAGIISWERQTIADILKWSFDLMTPDRADGNTPNERAIHLLKRWHMVHPERFPWSNDLRGARRIIGLCERDEEPTNIDDTDTPIFQPYGPTLLYTTLSHLSGSDFPLKAGVQPLAWLRWCIDQGHAFKRDHFTLKGNQRERWYVFPLGDIPDDEKADLIRSKTQVTKGKR